MITYLSPYSTEKQIGRAYNEAISEAPDGWICITDHDAMFLHPESKRQIEEIAARGEYDLYGCMTNRLALTHQLVKGMFDVSDIGVHVEVAKTLHETEYGKVGWIGDGLGIAGLLMLFRKETWMSVGGFSEAPEDCITVDLVFSRKIKSKAIMRGVYMFHLYRWWSKCPQLEKTHLLTA